MGYFYGRLGHSQHLLADHNKQGWMQIRPYMDADFDALYELEERCFTYPIRFPRWYMRRLVGRKNGVVWIAEMEGQLAGFVVASWARRDGLFRAYIETIEVDERWRRHGLGRALLQQVEASSRAVGASMLGLHVEEGNSRAISLYESCGFEVLLHDKNYYEDGKHALLYCKHLV